MYNKEITLTSKKLPWVFKIREAKITVIDAAGDIMIEVTPDKALEIADKTNILFTNQDNGFMLREHIYELAGMLRQAALIGVNQAIESVKDFNHN